MYSWHKRRVNKLTVRLSLHCRDRPRNQQMWQTSKPKQRLVLESLLISSIDEKPDGRISCADGRSQIIVTSSDQNINRISIGSTSPLSISFIHFDPFRFFMLIPRARTGTVHTCVKYVKPSQLHRTHMQPSCKWQRPDIKLKQAVKHGKTL